MHKDEKKGIKDLVMKYKVSKFVSIKVYLYPDAGERCADNENGNENRYNLLNN